MGETTMAKSHSIYLADYAVENSRVGSFVEKRIHKSLEMSFL